MNIISIRNLTNDTANNALLPGVACLLCLLPGSILAASNIPEIKAPTLGSDQIINLILSLFLVLIAVILVLWVMRYLQGISNMPGTMSIIGSLSLTTKDKLVLVKIGNETILIASSPGATSLIHVLDANNTVVSRSPSLPDNPVGFSAILDRVLGKGK